jgi:hypothetical protein
VRRIVRDLQRWLPVLAVVLSLVVAWWVHWPGPVEETDEAQLRLDVAAPLPAPGRAVVQSLVAQHDGLSAVELLLAVYPQEDEDKPGTLTVRLLDDQGRQITGTSWQDSVLVHNQPLRASFKPQVRSSGRQYRLILEGSEGNRATVWAFSLRGYERGSLMVGGELQAGSLRFETFYQYQARSALSDVGRVLLEHAWLYPLLALTLLLPGLALISPTWLRGRDPAAFLGAAVAGSLVMIPVAWLWWTWLGLRVNGAVVVLGLACAAVPAARHWRAGRLRPSPETWALAAVVVAGLAVRLLAIRDLVVPPWVDSPQHLLISRMMAETGRVPAGYRPWMPVDVFVYHFGFHALIASLMQLGDEQAVELILVGGQVLNALAPLAVYSATFLLTRRRRASLVAAFLVALLSLFPSYYVTWGRYTQLSGLLVLAPLLGLAWRFLRGIESGRAVDVLGKALVVGLLVGGLYLVHARVWVFALVWVGVAAGGVWVAGTRSWRRAGRLSGWLAGVGGFALVVAAPWHVRVVRQFLSTLVDQVGERGDPGVYNVVPWAYLTSGWEPAWLGMAAVGLVAAVAWGLWRKARHRGYGERAGAITLIGIWTAAVTGMVNVNRLGVPTFGLINNNSWVISLFVPVGIVVGWLADEMMRLAVRWRGGRTLVRAGVGAAVVWCGLYGSRQNVAIINPETVLAGRDDMELISRAEALLPAEAVVLVDSWAWLGQNSWAGSDAGYWILPLTGRQTTMPAIGYGMDPSNLERVNSLNRELDSVEEWGAPETLDLLRERGVTHVFIGARGGQIRPELLMGQPQYRLLETNGAAWLFALEDPPS